MATERFESFNPAEVRRPAADEVLLITSGDLRLSANQVCWPAQRDMEEKLTAAFRQQGIKLVRAHAYDETLKHGFISSQRRGMDVFMNIHPEARIVFATAAWQYSHHVLPGLRTHKGPILTVANWSGQWPGLVGLSGCATERSRTTSPMSRRLPRLSCPPRVRLSANRLLRICSIAKPFSASSMKAAWACTTPLLTMNC
jgi:hypothetical protein